MPLNVLFDFQIFCRQRVGGVSRYFVSLIQHLLMEHDVTPHVLAPIHVNQYLKSLPTSTVTGHYIARPPYSARILSAVNLFLFAALFRRRHVDLIHQSYYNKALSHHIKRPLVVTVHDLIHELMPSEFNRLDNLVHHKRAAIEKAAKVICVSHFTKQRLLETYNIPERTVEVIHLASSFDKSQFIANQEPVTPFLLYVGKRPGYKNFERLLRAYALDRRVASDFHLLCFGGGKLTTREQSLITKLGIPAGRVIHKSGDDSELATHYSSATALLFPSLQEGFGLPVLEAMQLGCPVVCSNATSLPEVGGQAARYFNPLDIEDMADAITSTVYDSQKLNSLRQFGLKRAKEFSWGKCARETLSVYNEVAAH
jgi:glycosyltransferase involved in cell wall biosynthesis